ncbi:MAG TPA: hypothetical protein VK427_11350 [Kofleriaceae bacterium]|nr:hypothetical protein [Kofleriaceae bacterium]
MVKKYAGVLACLALAVVFVQVGRDRSDFACERMTCTYRDHAFPVAEVRDVQFVERLAKTLEIRLGETTSYVCNERVAD